VDPMPEASLRAEPSNEGGGGSLARVNELNRRESRGKAFCITRGKRETLRGAFSRAECVGKGLFFSTV